MPSYLPPPLQDFDDAGFWRTLWRLARRVGRHFVEICLLLYYTAQKPNLPLWEKLLIYSALLYFITPLDVVPDFLPLGLTDDLAVLSAALASISAFIDDAIRAQVQQRLQELFGRR